MSRGLRAETKNAHVEKIYWSNFLGPVLILGVLREPRAFWLIYGIICAFFLRQQVVSAKIYDFSDNQKERLRDMRRKK